MNENPSAQAVHERHIRVFISSTFRDMHHERELLVKQVFPELRRLCAQRFVTFTEIDLRWGISDEQSAEGKVLPICLQEIHLSRPYFIGLLGERYGWIPDSVPPSLIAKEPWLQEHVGERTSITELEILHGVLNNPAMANHAYFYFRDPSYLNSIPENARKELVAENEESANKLKLLKERIRKSGLPLVDNYANPEALAADVRERFLELINQLYPESDTPDLLKKEALAHESYAARKLLAFVPRPAHTDALDAFVSAECTAQGLVVTGDSGGGKTALLADWVRHWRENHRDDFVFAHYFGATPDSASVLQFLHRLLGELKQLASIPEELPFTPEKMRNTFPLWLAQASDTISSIASAEKQGLTEGGASAPGARIVLVMDGLNQIEGDEPDLQLAWLPRHFPAAVRVLASAMPGPALDTLGERGWVEHRLPAPSHAERVQMIDKFFQHYRKEPGEKLRDQLAAAPGSASPLFLRTALEELRQFGNFEQLPSKVAEYLTATTPEELFRLVFSRWQEDFDAGRELVRRALSLLWAARQGLSEIEWREMLGSPDEPLLRQVWSPLFLAIEPHLTQRSGVFGFSHSYIRDAVTLYFLKTKESQRSEHQHLAEYFILQKELTQRKLEELPWQLKEAELWPLLVGLLTDMLVFAQLQTSNPHELMRYWRAVGERADLVQEYDRCLAKLERKGTFGKDLGKVKHAVALFLLEAGRYDAAAKLFNDSFATAGTMEDADWYRQRTAHALGATLLKAGRIDEAGRIYEGAIKRCEEGDPVLHKYLPELLNGFAIVKKREGKFAQAEKAYRQAIRLESENVSSENAGMLSTLKMNLGVLFMEVGNQKEAGQLLQEAADLAQALHGKTSPEATRCVVMLGRLNMAQGQMQSAKHIFERAYFNMLDAFGNHHPETLTVASELSSCLMQMADYDDAASILKDAYKASREQFGPGSDMTLTIANNLAALHSFKNEWGEAEIILREVVQARRKRFPEGHPELAESIQNLARVLSELNQVDEAQEYYRQSLEMLDRFYGPNHPKTLLALHGLAELQEALGPEAITEDICRRELADVESQKGASHPDTGAVLNKLALTLKNKGDYAAAEQLYLRALSIAEVSFGLEHDATAAVLYNLAALRASQKNFEGAKPFFERAFPIWEKKLGHAHPNTDACLNGWLTCLLKMGNVQDVERIGEEQIRKRIRALGATNESTVNLLVHVAELIGQARGPDAAKNFVARIAIIARDAL